MVLEALVGVVLVVASIAMVALLVNVAVPARDPGPWWLDERLFRNGQCRFRSRATERRCIRKDGHRGQHDSGDSGGPVAFG